MRARLPQRLDHALAHGLALVPLLACTACSGAEPAGPGPGQVESALLVTLDTTRLNSLGTYGSPVDSTPHLDRLAAESLVYDWCRTVAPITLPAHASMLTGLYPLRHGLRDNGLAPLPAEAETLAERARAAGLATAAFVAALVLDRQYRLDQGFELYDQPERPVQQLSSRYAERGAEVVLPAARAWLDGLAPDRRFFLWIHLFDPHAPYEPPERFLAQVAPPGGIDPSAPPGIAHYFGEVAKVDHELGEFFEHLRAAGRLERTALLVVADHGEALMTRGEPNHAPFVYDTTMRVPFFLRYPDGYRAGERSPAIVSVVDVAPTLCAALGLDPLEDVDGLDLWRRPDSEAAARRGVYFESYHGYLTYGWAPLSGFVDAGGKYIHSPRPELYRPAEDREERRDLSGSLPTEGYRAAIAQLAARSSLPPARFAEGNGAADRLEAVAQLGYATAAPPAGALPGPLEDTGRPAPAERDLELVAFLEAQRLLDLRQVPPAVALLGKIVSENPGHQAALEKLALAHVLSADWPAAVKAYERRLALGPGPPATYVNLGLAYELTGDLERAEAMLVEALALDPGEPTARANLERVRERRAADPPEGSGHGE